MMNELNQFYAVIGRLGDWGGILAMGVFLGIALLVYQMQIAEEYERLLGCRHGWWGFFRRVMIQVKCLCLCWCAIYANYTGWEAWPPLAVLVVAIDFETFFRIMIARQDIMERSRRRDDTLLPTGFRRLIRNSGQ